MASPYWERRNPSFSSSLLDAIYKSIDGEEQDSGMRKSSKEDMASFMIEKWMEKKAASDLPVLVNSCSSSTSSDSSSSDSASTLHGTVKSTSSSTSTSSSCYNNRPLQRPKPIRTGKPSRYQQQPKKHREGEGGFVKTKSRALKIYSDLKQPISPGGRISNFLNSMFSAKKPSSDQKYSSKSTCSSASSLSRSCLSKTPSSNNGTKRSVRFYPVSVIVDEHCRPCGHKNLHKEDPNPITTSINEQLKLEHVLEDKRRVREAAMDLLKNYRQNQIHIQNDSQELDGVDDDAISCASSDLFELDNLSSIGVHQRYIQDLPVYETTHLATNQRIANRFVP